MTAAREVAGERQPRRKDRGELSGSEAQDASGATDSPYSLVKSGGHCSPE